MTTARVVTAMATVVFLGGAVWAQNAPSAQPTPSPPARQDCAAQLDPGDGKTAPQTRGQGGNESNANLSEQLSRSDGVICPPHDVDPEIANPPPGGGRTPVIPPPGGPGGDPTVRPK